MTADELYDIVERYAAFGDHHTGTEVDVQTTDWLAGRLELLGAEVSYAPFSFERWDGQAGLKLDDGLDVPNVPVFYAATGRLRSRRLTVVDLPGSAATSPQAITDAIVTAPTADAVVLAIAGPDDQPVAANRHPRIEGGRPGVVVPANWADRVRSGAELAFDATMVAGQSANLIALLGVEEAPEVTVTTPLTGWTPAAGERGTGLAAAIAITADLAVDHRVRFVACSGHELSHDGLRHWLSSHAVNGDRVVHLGASVGAITAEGTLDPARLVATTAQGERRSDIQRLAKQANWKMLEGDTWLGEGGTWRANGAEVLSFLGSSRFFHTPADLPAAATSPQALELATSCALGATRRFLRDGA